MKTDPLALQAERRILLIRRHRLMLDYDLANLYGVEARALNQAVKRNLTRFPDDFMFQLTPAEADELRGLVSQSVPPAPAGRPNSSQSVMSSRKHRGRAYRPYAFTEQGVAKLGDCLKELEETSYWLELLVDSATVSPPKMAALLQGNDELLAIFTTISKKTPRFIIHPS